jgi:hypothetical protein
MEGVQMHAQERGWARRQSVVGISNGLGGWCGRAQASGVQRRALVGEEHEARK